MSLISPLHVFIVYLAIAPTVMSLYLLFMNISYYRIYSYTDESNYRYLTVVP